MKIRKLTVADRKRLTSLIKKLTDTTGDKSLLKIISSTRAATVSSETEDSEQDSSILVGLNLLKALLETLETETQEWFSSLIGVTVDEFYNLPIDTEALIIQQIVEAEEIKSFFTIVSGLVSKMQSFQGKFAR
jgi:hypothetical protein